MQQTLDFGAVGIDFGSLRSVIAVAKKRGVDVIVNEGSNRETPNVVGFGQSDRRMGDQAQAQAKSNFKNTITFFNRLLGIPSDYPPALLREETKWISSRVTKNEQGKIVHEVAYQGETKQFLPEQVTAAMLGKLRSIVRLNNLDDREAVISVPSYYTEAERKALLEACKIADLQVARLVNEDLAIATTYGVFRKSEFKDLKKERNVVFVDWGHSKLSAFVCSFTKDKATIITKVNERNLGAREVDWALVNYYAQKFEEQTGLSIFETKKAVVRLIEAVEKQRKILSANLESPINVECLIEENDLSHTLTREELDKLMEPVVLRIETALKQLQQEIEQRGLEIHSVEITGGASRTPAFQEIVKKVFKKDQAMKTLNATESVARGCATWAALLSPAFHVTPYTIEESNYLPIRVEWKFLTPGMEIEPKNSEIFKKGCTIPNIKSLTFKQVDPIDIRLFYDPAPVGFSGDLLHVKIPATKPKEEDYGIKIRIKLTDNGLLQVTDCNLIEDYTVEEKVELPAKAKPAAENKMEVEGAAAAAATGAEGVPAAGGDQPTQQQAPAAAPEQQPPEPQYEIKQKKKTRTTNVTVSTTSFNETVKNVIDDFFQLEANMTTQDRIIQDTVFRKNKLESYIYSMRDRIVKGQLGAFTEPSLIATIDTTLQNFQDWLYGAGADVAKSQYIAKTEELEKLCEPSAARFREEENFQYSAEELNRVIAEYQTFVQSTDVKYAHIAQDQRQKVAQEVQKARDWLSNAVKANESKPKYVDSTFTSEQVEALIKQLHKVNKPIVNTPKPEPKKVETTAAKEAASPERQNPVAGEDIVDESLESNQNGNDTMEQEK